jgi:hypothetical protein
MTVMLEIAFRMSSFVAAIVVAPEFAFDTVSIPDGPGPLRRPPASGP